MWRLGLAARYPSRRSARFHRPRPHCGSHSASFFRSSSPVFRPSSMRSLSLHVSALNDDEYTLFTSSFADLVASDVPFTNDEEFEKQTVSVREARAWLRGRYPDLPMTDLDQVRISLSAPRCQLPYHGDLDPTPVLPKSRSRHRSHQRAVFCHPSSCLACSWWSRVRQKPRFQTRFVLNPHHRLLSSQFLCEIIGAMLFLHVIRAGD